MLLPDNLTPSGVTEIVFTVKEGPRGEPRLMLEDEGPGLALLRSGFLMFYARPGVTLDEIIRLRQDMHRMIGSVGYTSLVVPR